MAPPNKRQRHLRYLNEQKKLERTAEVASAELVVSADNVSDDEILFFEGMHRVEKLIGQHLEDLIRWRPGAGSHLRNCVCKEVRSLYRCMS